MRVAFRVDASARMGIGHLSRCLSLAQALTRLGAECCFLARDFGIDISWKIQWAGFSWYELRAPTSLDRPDASVCSHASWAGVDWRVDVQESLAALASFRPDWVIVDHYSFDAQWHRTLRDAMACRVAAIDDLGDRDLDVDLVIDHNHTPDPRTKYGTHLQGHVPILAGPHYALIEASYVTARRYVPHAHVRSIGIFMGGADQGGYSAIALQACDAAGFAGAIEIVSTSANPHLIELREQVARRPNRRLSIDLPDLADFFVRHDLQLGASGGSTWERCCVGTPTLAIVVAENQKQVLRPLADMGVLLAIDEAPVRVATLAHALRVLINNPQLRESLAVHAGQLVDGRGAQRVAEYLLQQC